MYFVYSYIRYPQTQCDNVKLMKIEKKDFIQTMKRGAFDKKNILVLLMPNIMKRYVRWK